MSQNFIKKVNKNSRSCFKVGFSSIGSTKCNNYF